MNFHVCRHLVCVTLMFAAPIVSADDIRPERHPIVIAHRGASGYLPEHTLECKALAYAQGADYLEQDIVLTSDDVPIVSHDIHLDRVTDVATRFPGRARDDGRFYAIDFTWTEVQQLRVTERVDKHGNAVFPDRYPICSGRFRIVSLEEELTLIRELNRSMGRNVGIYPEIKQPAFHHRAGKDLSAIVLQVLTEFGYTNRESNCFVQCFEWEEVCRLRQELQCELPLIYLVSRDDHWESLLADTAALSTELTQIKQVADGLGPNLSLILEKSIGGNDPLPTGLVTAAREAGLQVHAWTLRADELACGAATFDQLHRAVRRTGIDGCFSDFPDQTRQAWTQPEPSQPESSLSEPSQP